MGPRATWTDRFSRVRHGRQLPVVAVVPSDLCPAMALAILSRISRAIALAIHLWRSDGFEAVDANLPFFGREHPSLTRYPKF